MPSAAPISLSRSIVSASFSDIYSDSRTHGYQGPSRTVRLPRCISSGGGAVAKSEDGLRCVVAGKESLRILRMTEGNATQPVSAEHKSVVGRGGHRIDASRNIWTGSGLKIDSVSTDVVWGHGAFNNKILTSARNGELIMWDLQKSGNSKYERRTKDHIRAIHKLSYSHVHSYYCISGSADGDVRLWDLRDMSKSRMKIHHPTGVRSLIFSPGPYDPLHITVGLDNGSIYRWDIGMGQKGQLDRLPVAHAGPILSLDWYSIVAVSSQSNPPSTSSGIEVKPPRSISSGSKDGRGWVVSGGLDRCVKVWDLTTTPGHIASKPTYTLHTPFPVRKVLWRPGYECEVVIVSGTEFGSGFGPNSDSLAPLTTAVGVGSASVSGAGEGSGIDAGKGLGLRIDLDPDADNGNAVEIWDVRRGWIAKWTVDGSRVDGGVTDIAFRDPHALWAQHSSGTFSQLDLRYCSKPLDAIPRGAVTWDASGSLLFVVDRKTRWEIPYDDLKPSEVVLAGDEGKAKLKGLGNRPHVPISQSMGTFVHDGVVDDQEAFARLARGYVLEGADKQSICKINAAMALQVGHHQAAQTWLLLLSLFEDLSSVDDVSSIPSSRLSVIPALPHSKSAPEVPSMQSPPSSAALKIRSSSLEPFVPELFSQSDTSPLSRRNSDQLTLVRPTTTTRAMTPSSSNSSSPHRPPRPSPSFTPRPTPTRLRRDTDIGITTLRPKRPPFRHMSMSNPNVRMRSPETSRSLRHVGEGALDDSDSSSDSNETSEGRSTSLEPDVYSARSSPSPTLNSRMTRTFPSPLSQQHFGEQWAENEDDEEASASPGSADTDAGSNNGSGDHGSTETQSQSRARRNSARYSRRRSSNAASVGLSATPLHRPLEKQESHSSIRTITVGDVSGQQQTHMSQQQPDTVDPRRSVNYSDRPLALQTARAHPSVSMSSEQVLKDLDRMVDDDRAEKSTRDEYKLNRDQRAQIRVEDTNFRKLCWAIIRETLELFADEGDVQMCAALCCIIPHELGVGKWRVVQFLESYIELLSRSRLHPSAAYVRKVSQVDEVSCVTALQTTVYSSCGRCRKPLNQPAYGQRGHGATRGDFSWCLVCKSHSAMCTICHLPVRGLLFHCAICGHGGHQACYSKYLLEPPLVDFPPSSMESRGRTTLRAGPNPRNTETDTSSDHLVENERPSIPPRGQVKLLGHPCPAGCGHFCWAASEIAEAQGK